VTPNGTPAVAAERGSFDSFLLNPALRRGIADAGFTSPRPIQLAAIPAVLAGRDVLGLAQTGTGKTAAFGIPILQRLYNGEGPTRRRVPGNGPRALVIAPTRELARQIHDEVVLVGRHLGVRATMIFGGVPQGSQVRALAQRPDLVVACPGRLLDLHSQRAIDLSQVEVLVLDEADHMFDMGFLPHIRRILGLLPKQRQNLFFSATMPKEIRGLADELLRDPVAFELSNSRPADTIEDALVDAPQTARLGLLVELLRGEDFRSAIVFLRTKHRARRVATQLEAIGLRAVALQGNMSQGQRERAMEGFRKGTYDVLVATDIAARGIDVAAVSHVINFDVPTTPEAYTHRIGRTGRAERTGKAFTFVGAEDAADVRAIERHLGRPIPRVRLKGAAITVDVPDTRGPAPVRGRRGGGAPAARQGARGAGAGSSGGRGRGPGGGSGSGRPGGGRGPGGPRNNGNSRPTGFPRPTSFAAPASTSPAKRSSGASSHALPFGSVVDEPKRRR
jgi:ATP-dependent RNA helicase RhlE